MHKSVLVDSKVRRLLERKRPGEVPLYTVPEAAHYLQLPAATLRSWVLGRYYAVGGGRERRRFQPLIELPDKQFQLLSFFNLVEAHVLSALRRSHRIKLHDIRRALKYVTRRYHRKHPLLDRRFETDGVKLFVRELGRVIDVTAAGQLVIRQVIDSHLQRVERDAAGVVARLYPFTRIPDSEAPRIVLIDPRLAFGKPILAGTRIPTAVIAERYKAGDSIEELARDYEREGVEIEEALRCELQVAA